MPLLLVCDINMVDLESQANKQVYVIILCVDV